MSQQQQTTNRRGVANDDRSSSSTANSYDQTQSHHHHDRRERRRSRSRSPTKRSHHPTSHYSSQPYQQRPYQPQSHQSYTQQPYQSYNSTPSSYSHDRSFDQRRSHGYQSHGYQQSNNNGGSWRSNPPPANLSAHRSASHHDVHSSTSHLVATPAAREDIILNPPIHIRRQEIDQQTRQQKNSEASDHGPSSTSSTAELPSSSSSNSIPPLKCAFVTLVMLGDAYIPGALVLAHSIRSSGSKSSLVCMVSSDVSSSGRTDLSLQFDDVIEVPLIEGAAIHQEWKRYTKSGAGGNGQPLYQWINFSFTKFNVLTLTQYDRVCLLDADMLCVAQPDSIFELSAPAGICSIFTDIATNNSMHGQHLTQSQVEASWRSYGIRGCLYLLKPDRSHFELVRSILKEYGGYGEKKYYIGADEKLMTDLYLDQWTHAHWQYGSNSWKSSLKEIGREAIFLHFVTEKPWQPKDVWPDVLKWGEFAEQLLNKYDQLRPRFQMHLDAIARHKQQQLQKQQHSSSSKSYNTHARRSTTDE